MSVSKRPGYRNRRQVRQIRDGNVVAVFESIFDASRKTGFSATGISDAANGKRKSACGFVWDFVGGRRVRQISGAGDKTIAAFQNAREASQKTGIEYNRIYDCAHGKRRTAGGYVWRFEGD